MTVVTFQVGVNIIGIPMYHTIYIPKEKTGRQTRYNRKRVKYGVK